jgi:hypothetical protein
MAVVTYLFPVAGLVAPTQAQMAGRSEVVATVEVELYDTAVAIAHNMQLSAAELTQGFPEVQLEFQDALGDTAAPFVSSKTTTTVVLALNDAGAGAVIQVAVRRPHSMDQ